MPNFSLNSLLIVEVFVPLGQKCFKQQKNEKLSNWTLNQEPLSKLTMLKNWWNTRSWQFFTSCYKTRQWKENQSVKVNGRNLRNFTKPAKLEVTFGKWKWELQMFQNSVTVAFTAEKDPLHTFTPVDFTYQDLHVFPCHLESWAGSKVSLAHKLNGKVA